MVLRRVQIQRCDPAGCTLRIKRVLLNEIARLSRDRTGLHIQSGFHTDPAGRFVQPNESSTSCANHPMRYHVTRSRRRAEADHASNGPSQ